MKTASAWMQDLQRYRAHSMWRSVLELAVTAVCYSAAWLATILAIEQHSFWLAAILYLPTAGFLVRLFVVQHDCGHGSFFRRKRTNDWIGRALSVFTMIPYDHWRRDHATHHAAAGNLDHRGVGDVETLTIADYRRLSPFGKLRYRLYRDPVVMFGLGPAYLMLVRYRFPLGAFASPRSWATTMGTNAAIVAAALLTIWRVGLWTFLVVQIPVVLTAASIGVWLFYVQHQFEETYWRNVGAWNVHEAALHGSSYYNLPAVLHWFTGNVGIHHVHHLSARIPFYRLPEVLRDFPELADVGRISIAESFRGTKLALWDEKLEKLVTFAEARY